MPPLLQNEYSRDSFVEVVDPVSNDAAAVALDAISAGVRALQDSRQAVCITDAMVDLPGPTITYVNDAYTDIFACDAMDVIGLTPRFGQGPLTNRRVLDRLRVHLTAGASVEAQAINYRFDRSTFRLRWNIDPIRSDGAVVGFLAHMRDITLEDRLRRRLAALDTLMHRGRVASTLTVEDRAEPIAVALAAALRPVVAEIGSAAVRIHDAREVTQIDDDVLDDCDPDVDEVAIGTIGSVLVSTHPDAEGLVDRLAIGELAEHARWLFELGEPRAQR